MSTFRTWVLGYAVAVSTALAVPDSRPMAAGNESEYVPLESVLVNLEGRRHYLRVDIQLMVDNPAHAAIIKAHMPAVRDALILLFSNRNPDQLLAAEEREKLRQAALKELSTTLAKYEPGAGLKDLFFTDFLVQ